MGAPRFSFQVQIDALTDEVPGTPAERAQVSASVQVSAAGGPLSPGSDPTTFIYATNTDYPAPVPVQIVVTRFTQPRIVRGTITKTGGHWHWSGGGLQIPLAANDPCVTRVWPGGRGMTDHEYAEFCTTRILEAPVPPGVVATVNLTYDLATGQVAGDVSGPPGTRLPLRRDLSPNGAVDLVFTLSPIDRRGFAADVRPLFRDKDVQSMLFAFNLASYDDVTANATQIYQAVSVHSASFVMPCDGPWPPGPVLVFKQWMDQGLAP